MTKEEKTELAEIIAKAVVEALKEKNSTIDSCDNFESILKQFPTIAPSLYGRDAQILNEDFIRTFSSGQLCDYTTCKTFLERDFLKDNIGDNLSDCAKKKAAYFTYIELVQPVVNPIFMSGKENLLSVLLDIRPSDLKDVIHYQKYVVVNSYEKFIENNTVLSAKEQLDIEKYGRKVEVATGGEAIQHLLATFNMQLTLDDLKKKHINSGKKLSVKNQKRISLIKYFIDNNININDIMISVLPVPQVDILLEKMSNSIREDFKTRYSLVAIYNDNIKRLNRYGSHSLITDNAKRMLQESIEKLFKKSLEIYGCEDFITGGNIVAIENKYDNAHVLDYKKTRILFDVPKDYNVSVWENFVAMLLCLDISFNEEEKFMFNSFLLDNNVFEDQFVWKSYVYNT